jgi:hypothetical protein
MCSSVYYLSPHQILQPLLKGFNRSRNPTQRHCSHGHHVVIIHPKQILPLTKLHVFPRSIAINNFRGPKIGSASDAPRLVNLHVKHIITDWRGLIQCWLPTDGIAFLRNFAKIQRLVQMLIRRRKQNKDNMAISKADLYIFRKEIVQHVNSNRIISSLTESNNRRIKTTNIDKIIKNFTLIMPKKERTNSETCQCY